MLNKIITKWKYLFSSPENYGKHLGVKFGKNCYISTKGFSSEGFLIEIGDNVRIAREVLLLTHGGIWALRHVYSEMKNFDYFGKIKIGSNVYIGQRTIIMPGVTIGDNCIIGAASIVNKSIPDNSVIAGNPVKYISSTDDYVKKIQNNRIDCHNLSSNEKLKYIQELDDTMFLKRKMINI